MTNRAVDLPDDYQNLLAQLKNEVRTARLRAHHVVNTELLCLYWTIGKAILDQQHREGWGTKVIDCLAADLRAEFPDMTGFSRSNLKYMRQMAASWSREAIGQQAAGQLPWGHIMVLLDKVPGRAERDWYVEAVVTSGWSRNVLLNQIKNQTHRRVGAAPSNFPAQLSSDDSELVQQVVKDPYVFDFLGLTGQVAERDLEQALMDRLQQTLLELGHGFAFVGRQVHFEVDGDDFYVDLLFFHVDQLRYVVVELKIGKFAPELAGKLGFYVSLVDDILRKPSHAPSVGLLLCANRNERVVRYSLGSSRQPMAVSTYAYDSLPPAEQIALPNAEDVAAAMDGPITHHGQQTTLAQFLARMDKGD